MATDFYLSIDCVKSIKTVQRTLYICPFYFESRVFSRSGPPFSKKYFIADKATERCEP